MLPEAEFLITRNQKKLGSKQCCGAGARAGTGGADILWGTRAGAEIIFFFKYFTKCTVVYLK